MNDAKARVEIELKELSERLDKLNAFYMTDNFKGLKAEQQELLTEQIMVMTRYKEILTKRLANW